MIARSRTFPGLYEPMIVDLFAGGGGASMGIERAFMAAGVDRHVDLAINHDPAAIACHEVNHPLTEHLQCDVIEVDPRKVCAGRRVGYLHASPDCTDFSIAKGGTPIRTKQRRSLAWVVVQWAAAVRPDVITLENVREFQQWGPVRTRKDGDGYEPCPRRRGERFAQWVAALRGLGYQVEWRELRACDYGTPTTRNRLFIIARCDGKAIRWPEKTHGKQERWHDPATTGHHRRQSGNCSLGDRAPLGSDEGQRRAGGVQGDDHTRRATSDRTPREIHRRRDRSDAETPRARRPEASAGAVAPFHTAAECIDWSLPMLSIFATADQAKAWSKYHGIPRPRRPLAEKTMARIARGVVKYVLESPSPFLIQTVTASHDARGLVSALLTKHYGGVTGQPLTDPMPTVTATDHNALTAASLIKVQHASSAGVHAIDSPMPTVTAWPKGGGHAVVAAFIAKYYGCDQHGQSVDEPLHTIPTVERFGLVTISIGGEPYVVTDIAMRMLQPRELARAQGFPDDYVLDRDAAGKPLSKRTQVRLIGNSVCPPVIHALVDANVVSQCDWLTRPKRPQRTRQVQKATA